MPKPARCSFGCCGGNIKMSISVEMFGTSAATAGDYTKNRGLIRVPCESLAAAATRTNNGKKLSGKRQMKNAQ